jgi:hypothetical protein
MAIHQSQLAATAVKGIVDVGAQIAAAMNPGIAYKTLLTESNTGRALKRSGGTL